eukprot:CAMPEP_0179292550 /NCGR_PEP_ID=MMETSP0797-20121207/42911_1 /TAXON_ID=47934 /ORGANISM="Dinophysis acuminata, Strain DAEP01" /LENGTH=42 /DNA_ID= /DNA_START= /DNA_END= /DNA_ORIENTATION=
MGVTLTPAGVNPGRPDRTRTGVAAPPIVRLGGCRGVAAISPG